MERASKRITSIQIPGALAGKAKAARARAPRFTVAVAATFTAEPLEDSLLFWLKQLGLEAEVQFAPYNQVFQQLLDPSSLLAANSGGPNVLLVRFEDWQQFSESANELSGEAIERSIRELVGALQSSAQRSSVPHLVCICPPSSRVVAAHPQGYFQQYEALLERELSKSSVHVIPSGRLLDLYPVADRDDEYALTVGKIPYKPAFFTALATMIARWIYSLRATPSKVIVLDCDNTLWKGVCGEDGPLGVEIDTYRAALQEFMIGQHDAGMIVCLCSKNAEADVDKVFDLNPGMRLQRRHIVASRINWQPKSENLKDLAEQLQLGLDSFVFIDDNPLECAEVKAACPSVVVFELPHDEERIPNFLNHCWVFDHWKVTQEDRKRTALYAENLQRETIRKESAGLEEFLQRLDLRIDIRPMLPEDISRVSQLTQRTNQFNFSTIRRSEGEIAGLAQSGAECLVAEVRDRFGDYGLVGVIVFNAAPDAIFVDTCLLSCRALGRNVEHNLMARLGEIAEQRGLEWVEASFVPTEKNTPALNFLASMDAGFRDDGNGQAVYRFTAAYAQTLPEIKTAESLPVMPSETNQASGKGLRLTSQADLLNHIVSHLSSVESIADSVQRSLRSAPKSAASAAYIAPRTPTEDLLAIIWADVLKLDRVGTQDNFFEAGGHSLLAVQVISRIRGAFAVELPLRMFFDVPTVAAMAERIEDLQQAANGLESPPLTRVKRQGPVALSFAQERLWFLDQLEPLNPLYNVSNVVRLRGHLNAQVLEDSLGEIVRRHETLRTRFETVDGKPMQVVEPWRKLKLAAIDLTGLAEQEREQEARRLVKEEVRKPFHLSTGPLFRFCLFQLADDHWVLVLNTHHAISDGWSFTVLRRELHVLYEAFLQGKSSPLPGLPVQYADYAIWQRDLLAGGPLQRQLDYWKRQLEGASPVLELPTDRPRPAIATFRGARAAEVIPADLLESLKELSRREGVTLFMTLLGAFSVLLSRYAGQEDIVVGSPIAGRNDVEVEDLIGFFVNTLVLRTNQTGNPTFRELLARVRETTMGAYAHQDLPFEKLVEELHPERDLSRNPLFQVMLVLQNVPRGEEKLAGLTASPFASGAQSSLFDLTLIASEQAGGLRTTFEYNTDLFDAATIERMIGHFRVLLENIAAQPGKRLSELSVLTEKDLHRLLVEFNDNAAQYPTHLCLHDLVAQQAHSTPDAVAVVCGGERISYGELNARSNQLAHYLLRRGAGPDVLVGICLDRSVGMVVAVLGVLKAGGAYLPLDPGYPKERLDYILEDSQARLVVTQSSLLAGLSSSVAGNAVCIDSDWAKIGEESSEDPTEPGNPERLAYVLYTSGSTGKPKGVEVTHGNVVNFLTSMRLSPGLRAEDTLLAVTTLSFDIAGLELYLPLVSGAKVVLASREEAIDGKQLRELLERSQATVLQATPATWWMLLESGWQGSEKLKALCGGEALSGDLAGKLIPRCGELWNMYGPTETTIWSTLMRVTKAPSGIVPIGRPIRNTTVYVLDANRQPVPVGVPGELYIGGKGVGRGYLNRAELTAEKFLSDPFVDGGRVYATGDIVKFEADGILQYLSRRDEQIKLRGFRIELGEIEAVLDSHPGVQQSVAVVREDTHGDKRLLAYVITRAAINLAPGELRRLLQSQLPDYMVPSAIISVPAFPLTPNGKIDRRALPAPQSVAGDEAGYLAPRTPTEDLLAAIWAGVLKLDRVGVEDNFFQLGGHSLLATQTVSRVRQVFGIELPLRALFEAPTVAAMAARIGVLQQQSLGLQQIPLVPVKRDGPLPLSFAQERLWFLDQLEPLNPLYNLPNVQRLRGEIEVAVLQDALTEILRRHEALRTHFEAVDGRPVQVIDHATEAELAFTDLNALPEEQRELEARRLVAIEAGRPFDLATGPLLRASLFRLAQDYHILLLNTHHIVSDGWSLNLLQGEVKQIYEAFLEGKASPLAELPIQYADYTVWQREFLAGEQLDKQLGYWKRQLEGAPVVLDLPADRTRPAVSSYRGAQQTLILPESLLDGMREVSRKEGVTLFMTLLAGFSVLLSRYSGQEDILVGSPIAGRNRVEMEKLIGFFVNTLVMRANLTGNPSFRELLSRVRETTLGAYAHQDLPFEKLVEEVQPERDLSRNPLFQVMLVLQNIPASRQKLSNVTTSIFMDMSETSKFDLMLQAVEHGNGLRATLEYSTDLFDAETIQRMLRHLQRVLEAVVADPGMAVGSIPLLGEAEREQLLVEWNDTGRHYPVDVCIHQLFEQQVERTPKAVACVAGEQRVSYRELNARANRLAHFLKQRGAGRDIPVGVYLERSVEMVVALLGILKAGSAYVPLDRAYPKERVGAILEDAKAPLLVTQEALVGELPVNYAGERLILERIGSELEKQAETNPESGVRHADLAYILFTSGSTGRPKGVALEHRTPATFVQWCQEIYSKEELSGVLFGTSICFDVSISEIFVPLSAGGKIVVAQNALELPKLAGKEEVTLINTVPSAMAELVRSGGVPARVKVANLAGEALADSLVEEIYGKTAVKKVYNLYGPTETSYSTYTFAARGKSVTIGKPIAETQCYILDRGRELTPVGVPGEMYIAGAGVARGYYGREELTAERFVANPHNPGQRMYRTGDLCRWTSEGEIEYLGRLDHQVKVRGYRIELGEIEARLEEHVGVGQAVVVAREDEPGRKELVGYVVGKADAEELRARLKEKLPEYMIPTAIVVLEKFPLTPNGKVDRKALPAPEYGQVSEEGYVAPRNPVEEGLAGIWADVLRLPRVGVNDDFFELGGHSLLATQVISRMRQVFGVELPLRAIFEAQVLGSLASRIEKAQREQYGVELPPIERADRAQLIPLSFAQQRLWFLDQLEPLNPLYNVPDIQRLRGEIDVSVLHDTLAEILRRHEALRTHFKAVGGQPAQIIVSAHRPELAFTDLSTLPEEQRESEARRLVALEARRPFNLSTGPLLRASLFRLAPDYHILLLNTHHIVSDGWSLSLMRRELKQIYEAFLEGKASPLAELPIQYADYTVWQREFLAGEQLDKQLVYWKRQLEGAPVILDLPADRRRPAVSSYRGAIQTLILPESLLDGMREVSRKESVTLFMTLLAGFSVLLSRYSGQEDILVGSPIAGRNRVEMEKLIGFFVNTLVMRANLTGNPSFRELLSRVRETTLGAYAHQDLPFEKLVEEVQPERDLSRNPLFQVMLVLQNTPTGAQKLSNVSTSVFSDMSETSKFDLLLAASEHGNGLRTALEYSTDLFDAKTIQRMLRHLQRVLEAVVADPGMAVGSIPLLGEAEREQLLVEWNDTGRNYHSDVCIHHLFEQQVERTPHAVACVAGETRVSYRELNARANRLAHFLKERGAGRDIPVGVYLERSVEMVVALLGILKAGSAYVPLDRAYPKERVGAILEDAKAPLLVTQEALVGELPVNYAGERLILERIGSELEKQAETNPESGVRHADLAYILFTSGSTGRPKGVALEHRTPATFVQWCQEIYSKEELSGVLFGTSICFDVSISEIFVPLSAGGKIVVAQNALELPKLAGKEEVTLINTVPSAMAELVRSGGVPAGVKVANLAGEALADSLVEEIYGKTAVKKVYNLYGPTETSYSTYTFAARGKSVTIGKPIAETQCYILDRGRELTPVGVPGELYIAGAGVARGYYGREELTAERFVANPHNPGQRMYRTGDLCRWTSEGEIEYLGRLDHQVKVRGYRIELGEIEARLEEHVGVGQAVVVAREDEPGRKELVGYVVGKADAEELRARLKEKLPEYMIPTAIVVLEKFPLTPNGKVDRKALPAPEYGQVSEEGYVAPRNPVEEKLAAIWAEMLHLPKVGIRDNYFEIGGHSLLAAQLFARMESTIGKKLPLNVLFKSPTIEGIASFADQVEWKKPRTSIRPCKPEGSKPPIFAAAGIGATVLTFRELVKHLDRERPLYGLEPIDVDGSWMCLEELCAHYVRDIRAFQPEGPYHVIGCSFGGMVAFEIAQQLRAQNQEVGLIGLMDSYNLGVRNLQPRKEQVRNQYDFFAGRARMHLHRLWSRRLSEWPRYTVGRMLAVGRRLHGTLWRLWYRTSKAPKKELPSVLRNLKRAYEVAGLDYAAKAYPGRAVIFRAAGPSHGQWAERGWSGLTEQLEIIEVPGGHSSMMHPPHVATVADEMNKWLAQYEASKEQKLPEGAAPEVGVY